MLNSNTWNHLTAHKQMKFNSFKNNVTKKTIRLKITYNICVLCVCEWVSEYVCVCVCVCKSIYII